MRCFSLFLMPSVCPVSITYSKSFFFLIRRSSYFNYLFSILSVFFPFSLKLGRCSQIRSLIAVHYDKYFSRKNNYIFFLFSKDKQRFLPFFIERQNFKLTQLQTLLTKFIPRTLNAWNRQARKQVYCKTDTV